MPAPILSSAIPSALEEGHIRAIGDTYDLLPIEYPQIFYEDQAESWVEDMFHMGAFGTWDEGEEGEPFNMDSMAEGDTATFTQQAYNKAYSITYKSRRWSKYGVVGNKPEQMARGLRATEEQTAADVINNGFATTTGYDGVYLFSNTHPLKPDGADSGEDGDNLFTGALSYANVQAAETLMKATPNEANILINLRPTILWCSTGQERAAKEILSSTKIAGELSNTSASLPPLTVAPMSYVTSPYWGLKDGSTMISKNNLIFHWGDRPFFGVKDDPNSLNRKIWGYASWTCGYADWRGIVGSTGS